MAYDTKTKQETGEKKKAGVLTPTDILKDFRTAHSYWKPIHDQIEEDFKFGLGDQWEDSDVAQLRDAGVDALTINKIQPMIFMVSGIERQGRTDFVAFPEGQEDSLQADIATRLIKNMVKTSNADDKLSEEFEDGLIGGIGYSEVFVDYTHDLLNGKLSMKKTNPYQCFPDPDFKEYDLSDAKYFIKFVQDMSKDQLIELFPDAEDKIEALGNGKINMGKLMPTTEESSTIETKEYPPLSDAGDYFVDGGGFDLMSYYYKKPVKRFLVADKVLGKITEAKDRKQGEDYVEQQGTDAQGNDVAKLIEKNVPEIWVAHMVAGEILSNERAYSYPRWKSYPFIPFFGHRITTPMKKRHLMFQGIVRSLKSVQRELNKRRTQSLRHLNTSANSGWLSPSGAFDRANKAKVTKYGSSPGVVLEYDQEKGKPEKIQPTQLSSGHEILAQENSQDIKEISGINADLLVAEGGQDSGKAILLRQRQGLVMLQRMLDNYSRTKKILGQFLLSQMGEVYTVERAIKVCGNAFIKQNFSVPVDQVVAKVKARIAQGGEVTDEETAMVTQYASASPEQPAVDMNNQLVMVVDQDLVNQVFNQVLNDVDLGLYDVSVGEGPFSETIKMANFMILMDLVEKGVPIPPDILIQESTLSENNKAKIAAAIEQAQKAQQNAQAQAQAQGGTKK